MTNHASTHVKFQFSDFGFRFSTAATEDSVFARCCLLTLLVCAACNLSFAEGAEVNDSSRYQSGLRNSIGPRQLAPRHLEKLLQSLREKAGFLEMRFDELGFLRLGDRTKIAGGSATARELLVAAVDRARAIDLESHDRSSTVAFARLAKPVMFASLLTGAKIEVFPIEIDFSDFAHLRGDKAVLAAFDIGFVVLHELAHAALGLRDSSGEAGGPGECEDYINRIRRELGFPERQNYAARVRISKTPLSDKAIAQAELQFTRVTGQESRGKTQSFNLTWEAERVGSIRQADSQPGVKPPSVTAGNQNPMARTSALAP